jgi:beta-galactosidase
MITIKKICLAACALMLLLGLGQTTVVAGTFAIGETNFLLNGLPFQIKAGEMHPARVPHEYWADRLKMMHAMGLNTVSIYVFWNQQEPREDEFDFTGDTDIAEFVRLAQKEGLWVILRPGPYCCAEWEFGGFPWWLLKQPDMKVRGEDPRFLAAAGTYLKKLGEQLAPLQITHGGPIIMVQVENEYGSFGNDHVYTGKILDLDRAAGFDVPFFTADGGGNMMAGGSLPGVLPGLNGGDGPGIMKEIGKYRPNGPWFVPEFYPGWLDHWGEEHAQVGTAGLVRETEWKLTNNVSFCYYMIYGGTSFGFMAGANYGGHFEPQPTSYDYDSPMDEMGRPTKKFFALREVFARHLAPGETLPEVPATTPVIEIPKIELTESASVFDILGKPLKSEKPLSFEDLDQGYGYVLYRTKISGPVDAVLKIKELRDYAVVCVDGKRVAVLDRRHKQDSLSLVITNASATLDILVENGGRINYGREILHNRKGITESVMLGDRELTGWEMFKLPFDHVSDLKISGNATNTAPFVARGTFELSEVGDTFLDLRGWGKGIVIVNGHNLGRYWYIGPQQTLYCPGVWLKKGHNEIIVFEQIKDGIQPLDGIKTPVLNQLKPDENALVRDRVINKSENIAPRGKMAEPKFPPSTLVKTGVLADSDDEQTVNVPAQKARYLGLQALSSHNGDEFTTLAELDVLDAAGKTLSRKNWKVVYVDSEENFAEGDQVEKIFDSDPETFWHTLWSAPHTSHPHTLVIDFGAAQEVSGVRLLPRQDSPNGRIKEYRLYLSVAPFSALTP